MLFILDRKCYRKVCTNLFCGGSCKSYTRDVDGSCTNYVLVLKALPQCCDTQFKLAFPVSRSLGCFWRGRKWIYNRETSRGPSCLSVLNLQLMLVDYVFKITQHVKVVLKSSFFFFPLCLTTMIYLTLSLCAWKF